MPIPAANSQPPSVSIHINEESAPPRTRGDVPIATKVSLYAAASGAAFSIAGLAIAGMRNVGPWAITPCHISDTCKRLAEVTPVVVRCLTDAAILSRKLLCGGGGGPDPYPGCSWDERSCLAAQDHPSDDDKGQQILLGVVGAIGVGLGILSAGRAIVTPFLKSHNAIRQPGIQTVEMLQSAGTTATDHGNAGSLVNVALHPNPGGHIRVTLNVAGSVSRPLPT